MSSSTAAPPPRRTKSWPYLIVVAVLAIVPLGFCAMFPYALYANTVALVDGYRASHESAGTPGTVTIVAKRRAKSETICYGDFVPGSGGQPVRVQVEVPGPCKIGDRHPARLTEPAASLFTGYDEPRAWVPGSDAWVTYILLVVLFGVLTLVPLGVVVGAVGKSVAATSTRRLGKSATARKRRGHNPR